MLVFHSQLQSGEYLVSSAITDSTWGELQCPLQSQKSIAFEGPAVYTCTILLEKHGAWALQLDDECDDGEKWKQQQAGKATKHHIERAFQDAVANVGKWFAPIGEHRKITK